MYSNDQVQKYIFSRLFLQFPSKKIKRNSKSFEKIQSPPSWCFFVEWLDLRGGVILQTPPPKDRTPQHTEWNSGIVLLCRKQIFPQRFHIDFMGHQIEPPLAYFAESQKFFIFFIRILLILDDIVKRNLIFYQNGNLHYSAKFFFKARNYIFCSKVKIILPSKNN